MPLVLWTLFLWLMYSAHFVVDTLLCLFRFLITGAMVGAHLKECVEQISREGIKFPKKFVPPIPENLFPKSRQNKCSEGDQIP